MVMVGLEVDADVGGRLRSAPALRPPRWWSPPAGAAVVVGSSSAAAVVGGVATRRRHRQAARSDREPERASHWGFLLIVPSSCVTCEGRSPLVTAQ